MHRKVRVPPKKLGEAIVWNCEEEISARVDSTGYSRSQDLLTWLLAMLLALELSWNRKEIMCAMGSQERNMRLLKHLRVKLVVL